MASVTRNHPKEFQVMKYCAATLMPLGLVVLLAAIPGGSAGQQQPPRYQFKIGQELAYVGSSQFKYEQGSHSSTDKTTFWVTRKNNDGSWYIVAHNENTFNQRFGNDGQANPEKKQAFDAFDLFPDGRVANSPEGYQEKRLLSTFIRLPEDTVKAQGGWEEEQEAGDKSFFRLAAQSAPASGKWVFEKTDHGLFNEVYLSTSKALIHFDGRRGLITKVDSEYTQGYGLNGAGTGSMELKSIRQRDPEWIAQLTRETDLLRKAKAAVRSAHKAMQQDGESQDATVAQEKALREGRDKVKLAIIVAQFDAQLQEVSRSAGWYAEEQKLEEGLLNQPAANWDTVDFDGKKHSLADYRGKVVLLDFWYRGCGWCIKAMPQIKEVAEHYQDKPVVVLGMNTDREEKDAHFVVDKLKLNYTTLKAEGLPEKYGVRGFPALIIIDPKGVVRGRHVGYSSDLREELIKKIDGLLVADR